MRIEMRFLRKGSFAFESTPRCETCTADGVRADSGGQSSSLCELENSSLDKASAMNGCALRARSHQVSSVGNWDVLLVSRHRKQVHTRAQPVFAASMSVLLRSGKMKFGVPGVEGAKR